MEFPTLTSFSAIEELTENAAEDPTIRSRMESGALLTRARFTVARKQYLYHYRFLSEEEKVILEAFEISVGYGAEIFQWTHVKTKASKNVRFEKPIAFTAEPAYPSKWNVTIALIEI